MPAAISAARHLWSPVTKPIYAIALVMTLAVASACSNRDGTDSTERVPPDSVTTRPADNDARRPGTTVPHVQVEAAYRRFWTVADALDRHPVSEWRLRLAAVAADPLLTDVLEGLTAQHRAGLRQFGAVVVNPYVISVQPGRASIVDCQDASRSGALDAESGEPQEVGETRSALTALLLRGDDAIWRVSEVRRLDQSC